MTNKHRKRIIPVLCDNDINHISSEKESTRKRRIIPTIDTRSNIDMNNRLKDDTQKHQSNIIIKERRQIPIIKRISQSLYNNECHIDDKSNISDNDNRQADIIHNLIELLRIDKQGDTIIETSEYIIDENIHMPKLRMPYDNTVILEENFTDSYEFITQPTTIDDSLLSLDTLLLDINNKDVVYL
ncbi:hypothetical protein HK099_003892 [Clydaea vesicula]|uniref:Uncharacterized protein n=1 Tax=Clydaea vesicula TaxID=447962 RepID=A0AAD5U2N3_9FUNG|nr:hypothetical protein HK099_003892 [Clydaea vesicula]